MKPIRTLSTSLRPRRRTSFARAAAEPRVVDGPAAARAFIDALVELPLADWLDNGRRIAGDEASALERDAARTCLDAVVQSERFAVAAWHIRDALETAAHLVSGSANHLTRAMRRDFAAARAAAEDTALVILVDGELSRDARAILLAAFNPCSCLRRDRSPAPSA